ncbi:MAG TPA: hypothetical protein VFX10_05870 [Nitrospira sp.]|nr:hypothetical protein [Nitrospira sp.]
MSRHTTDELAAAFRRLADTAETFVNRAPKQKRLDAERSALLDAISHAQLVLSVYRIPNKTAADKSSMSHSPKNNAWSEKRSQKLQEQVRQLELRLETETGEREALQQKVKKAKDILESTSTQPAPVIPFRRVR